MAFDQPTRNRLAAFVGDARAILTEEFTHQLQADYGLNPERGEVMALESMQLDNARRATAELLRETFDYYLANAHSQGTKARKEALERIVREQAFTVLNRLCALRMAEARGLLIESIGSGYQSRGFKLYGYMTGGALGETGDAYRAYLFSLFDEFAVDLLVLFDRFSPEGRLFPSEKALLALLNAINHPDLAPLWGDDETIGWIYQYFNSQEERRKMRAESQAPRNSRELAVRNQFFTPRYVVEFLTDNTLGRTWYEMTLGETQLVDRCRYLVRRPREIFLCTLPLDFSSFAPWVQAAAQANFANMPAAPELNEIGQFALLIDGYRPESPEPEDDLVTQASRHMQAFVEQDVPFPADTLLLWQILFVYQRAMIRHGMTDDPADPFVRGIRTAYTGLRELLQNPPTDLPQEELLRQPVFIPRRACKDPRTILLLDPACGSMHFGLYAFDLYEIIYSEAWDLEEAHGPDALLRTDQLRPLHETYEDKAAFLRDVPRLIVEQNIHGIDIDPRAVQIAGLSLWLRAQRSWQGQGLKPAERPVIQRSNVVCAEPMPGDKAALQEFVTTLEPKLLGELVTTVFEKMELAGEAGSLLKVEEEIRAAVDAAQKRYQDYVLQQQKDAGYLPGLAPERDTTLLDLMELPDPEQFWATSEELVIKALKDYAAAAADGHTYTRRLFAQDAAQGFAFIDVCRKRYDVVLMNPPFGELTISAQLRIQVDDVAVWTEAFAAMVSRGLALLKNGFLGAITSRTALTLSRLTDWRKRDIIPSSLLIADVGLGVMDSAFVESCVFVCSSTCAENTMMLKDVSASEDVAGALCSDEWVVSGTVDILHRKLLEEVPENRVPFGIDESVLRLLSVRLKFEPVVGTVRRGFVLFDGFRFVRGVWEVPLTGVGESLEWVWYSKGGEYSRYYSGTHLVALRADNGAEMCAVNQQRNGQTAQAMQGSKYYFLPGATYTSRSQRGFSARCLPAGCITSDSAAVISVSAISPAFIVGWLNSRLVRLLIEVQSSFHKYEPGHIKTLPFPEHIDPVAVADVEASTLDNIKFTKECLSIDELDPLFVPTVYCTSIKADHERWMHIRNLRAIQIAENQANISKQVDLLYAAKTVAAIQSLTEIDDDSVVVLPRYELHEFA